MSKVDTKRVWFHGGPEVEDWHALRWDRDRSQSDGNAEGAGMYWTTDEEEARGYAHGGGILYRATMLPGFELIPKTRPTLARLRDLYEQASGDNQEVFLSNWNIEYPAPASAVDEALRHYSRQTSLFDALVTLYHDLFRYDADAFIDAMRTLGYDGYVIPRGDGAAARKRQHLVMYNPFALQISREE